MLFSLLFKNWDTSVIVTGNGLDAQGSIPGRNIFFSSQFHSDWPRLTQPPIQLVLEAVSLGAKRPGHEAGPSHLSSAKVKNGGAIPLLPHMPS
jgi:hypothetical protein